MSLTLRKADALMTANRQDLRQASAAEGMSVRPSLLDTVMRGALALHCLHWDGASTKPGPAAVVLRVIRFTGQVTGDNTRDGW